MVAQPLGLVMDFFFIQVISMLSLLVIVSLLDDKMTKLDTPGSEVAGTYQLVNKH